MKPGKFLTVRAWYLHGAVIPIGEVVELDDPGLISDLIGAGKAVAADAETAERLRTRSLISWTPAPTDDPWIKKGHTTLTGVARALGQRGSA